MSAAVMRSTAILLVLIGTVVLVEALGRMSRKTAAGHQVVHVSQAQQALEVWRQAGVKGRVLLYLNRNLHLDTLPENTVTGYLSDPSARQDVVTEQNFLYLALRANIVRKIYFVVPESRWQEIALKLGGTPGFYPLGGGFVEYMEGVQIIYLKTGDLPHFSEKTLVFLGSGVHQFFDGDFIHQFTADAKAHDLVVVHE